MRSALTLAFFFVKTIFFLGKFFEPAKISVFDLILSSTIKVLFKVFPILSVHVHELNQLQIFLHRPIIFLDIRSEKVSIMFFDLLLRSIYVKENINLRNVCLFTSNFHLITQLSRKSSHFQFFSKGFLYGFQAFCTCYSTFWDFFLPIILKCRANPTFKRPLDVSASSLHLLSMVFFCFRNQPSTNPFMLG